MKRVTKIIVLTITVVSVIATCVMSASATSYGYDVRPNSMENNIACLKSATWWNVDKGGSFVVSPDQGVSSWSMYFNNQHAISPGQGNTSDGDVWNTYYNMELDNPPFIKRAYEANGSGNYIKVGFNYNFRSYNTIRPSGADRTYLEYKMYLDGQTNQNDEVISANVVAMRQYAFSFDNFVLNKKQANLYSCGFYGYYDVDTNQEREFNLYDSERGVNKIVVEYDIYKKYDQLDDVTGKYNVYYEKVRHVNETQLWNGNAESVYLGLFRGVRDSDYGVNSYNDEYECIISNLNINMYISGQTYGSTGTTYLYTMYIAQPRNPVTLADYNNTVINELNSNWSDLNANVTIEKIDFTNVSIVDWLITQINSVLKLELFLGVTIGGILWFVIGIGLLFFVLKMFLGG